VLVGLLRLVSLDVYAQLYELLGATPTELYPAGRRLTPARKSRSADQDQDRHLERTVVPPTPHPAS
jgi:hypothetical protein